MMKRIFIILIVSCFSFLLFGCIGNLYVNKNYQFQQTRNFKLAIIPIGIDSMSFTDSTFTRFMDDLKNQQSLVSPAEIREKLMSDKDLSEILNKIIMKDYTKIELKNSPNLKSLLNENEFVTLSDKLNSADIMLIPIIFDLKATIIGYTFGYTKFRLYDIQTGALIFEDAIDLNVNLTGENGEKYLSIGLIDFVCSSYKKHFLKLK